MLIFRCSLQNWTFAYYCRVYGVGSYPIVNGTELTIESTLVDARNPSCFDTPGKERVSVVWPIAMPLVSQQET